MDQSNSSRTEVVPTGAALAAHVRGLDLSAKINDEAFRDIYTARVGVIGRGDPVPDEFRHLAEKEL
jgi:hypothetical protein